MTNVYWMHMPRNLGRPPPEDENAIGNSPESYLNNESLSASASSTSK